MVKYITSLLKAAMKPPCSVAAAVTIFTRATIQLNEFVIRGHSFDTAVRVFETRHGAMLASPPAPEVENAMQRYRDAGYTLPRPVTPGNRPQAFASTSSDPPPVRTRSEQQAPQTSKRAKAQAQKKLEKRLEQAATAQPVMAPPPPLPSGPPVCNDWNQLNGKPGCSRGSKCKFLHACLLCGGAHPGKYCPRSRGQ
jgi:hypothetical protein